GVALLAAWLAFASRSQAADPGASAAGAPATSPALPTDQPDESLLGTIDVNGSAQGLPPLPKMGIVPIITTGTADSIVNLVVRHDIDLSGQFEVLDESTSPPGPFTHTTPLDLGAWRDKGAEYV